jgi:hypothetical protein
MTKFRNLHPVVKNNVMYFCFAHVEPYHPLPSFYNLIMTRDFITNHRGPSFSLELFLDNQNIKKPDNGYYADYAFLYAGHLLSKQADTVETVVCSAHRKFVSRRPIGDKYEIFNNGSTFMADALTCTEHDLTFDCRSSFLTTKPLVFKTSVAKQYFDVHSASDFLRFLDIALESGVIKPVAIEYFFTEQIFLPGGLIGATPSSVFQEITGLVRDFVLFSDKVGYKLDCPNDPYQGRARSFFIERLISWALLREKFRKHFFLAEVAGRILCRSSVFGYLINTFDSSRPETKYRAGKIN